VPVPPVPDRITQTSLFYLEVLLAAAQPRLCAAAILARASGLNRRLKRFFVLASVSSSPAICSNGLTWFLRLQPGNRDAGPRSPGRLRHVTQCHRSRRS